MDIIGAAALIAVGIVIAAVLYARVHPTSRSAGSERRGRAPRDSELVDRAAGLARREEALASRELQLEQQRDALAERQRELERSLERLSGLSAARAKELLLQEVEDRARHDAARRIREVEDETKRDAERRVRNILSVCMQRLAAGHAAETTVAVVPLSAEYMKGRIIGREVRNSRALDNITGVACSIDVTPGAAFL